MKFSLTSYRPYRLFMTFRSIWGLWNWTQMIPHTQEPGLWKKIMSLAYSQAKLLCEVLLDLLQPIQAVLDLQVNLRPLSVVPNDSPYQKYLGFKKNQVPSLPGSQVTPLRRPWPPTVHTGSSCPWGPSEASGNGPKWLAIYKNLGFKKKSGL